MFTRKSLLTSLVGLSLTAGSAFAAQAPQVSSVLPGTENATAAGFINVRRIMDLFGAEIEAQPQFQQYLQYVEQGAPDVRTDINEVGVVADMESESGEAGIAVLGSIKGEALLKFLASQGLPFTESAYRGVNFYGVQDEKTSIELGFADEKTTVLSVVEGAGEQTFHKLIVDTLKGEIASLDAVRGLQLPENYLGSVSIKMTERLRALAAANELSMPLAASELITASVAASDAKDLNLEIGIRMGTAEDANGLQQILSMYLNAFGQQAGNAQPILEQILITVNDRTVLVTLDLPGDLFGGKAAVAD